MIHLKTTVWNGFTSWFLGLLPSLPASDISVYSTLSRCHLLCTQTPEGISKIHIWFCKSFSFTMSCRFHPEVYVIFRLFVIQHIFILFEKNSTLENICFSWLFLLLPTLKNLRWRWGELKEIPSGLQSLWIFVKLTASAVAYLSKKIHQINPFPWWNISLNSQ